MSSPRVLAAGLFLVFSLFFGSSTAVFAQTISQTSANTNASAGQLGQSFTATLTGTVTQIQVRPRSTVTTNIYFFNGPGSGTNGSSASAVSTQSVNLVNTGSDFAGLQTIILSSPLPVVAGNQYSFAFEQNASFSIDTANPYAGGTLITSYNNPLAPFDFVFTVNEVPPAAPVPTLSEWAMILFGLLLAGGAALYIQRRQVMA